MAIVSGLDTSRWSHARRGGGGPEGPGRQGHGLGLQEDELRGGGRLRRLQARQGRELGHPRARRGRDGAGAGHGCGAGGRVDGPLCQENPQVESLRVLLLLGEAAQSYRKPAELWLRARASSRFAAGGAPAWQAFLRPRETPLLRRAHSTTKRPLSSQSPFSPVRAREGASLRSFGTQPSLLPANGRFPPANGTRTCCIARHKSPKKQTTCENISLRTTAARVGNTRYRVLSSRLLR